MKCNSSFSSHAFTSLFIVTGFKGQSQPVHALKSELQLLSLWMQPDAHLGDLCTAQKKKKKLQRLHYNELIHGI